ncbi:hypothetical protein [Rubinisphaera sp. JC750]|uniref:hypothetical protein n=1 Tax=Rubinisphaera sp. JC750 TaxID=2898658 RepID=UPI001F1F4BBD|nr:hypothetical protein [Rubinisphaera sp. JC750]
MAHAYTPGLKVSERTTLHVRRQLPIAGKVDVNQGDTVSARDVVAEASIPGNVYPINLANQIGVSPADIQSCMLVNEGDPVEVGTVLGRSKGIFGLFKQSYASKTAGTLETVSKITGQIIIRGAPLPVQVLAYVPGQIIEVLPDHGVVIESTVSLIQGIFGIGGEQYGEIRMVCEKSNQPLTADLITADMRGQILIGGARMTNDAIEKAREVGASAVVSGGIDDQDLKTILGYDLGVAITGTEKIETTLIITEGFGDIGMAERTFELFKSRSGSLASVNGATQIRAGVMRPEVVIPIETAEKSNDVFEDGVFEGILEPGTLVRIIRDPYFGVIGRVAGLPAEPQVLGSGSKARVLEVEVNGEPPLTVPRANVEIIAG